MLPGLNRPIYLLDSSALIAAWAERYPRDIFPPVWQFMDDLNGQLRVCEEVRGEVETHAPELLVWLDSSSVDSRLSLTTLNYQVSDGVQRHMNRIANGWPNWRAVHSTNSADPWVIAYAHSLGGIVVSEERRHSREVKIPDVCDTLGVRHMNLLDLFRAEGFGSP